MAKCAKKCSRLDRPALDPPGGLQDFENTSLAFHRGLILHFSIDNVIMMAQILYKMIKTLKSFYDYASGVYENVFNFYRGVRPFLSKPRGPQSKKIMRNTDTSVKHSYANHPLWKHS